MLSRRARETPAAAAIERPTASDPKSGDALLGLAGANRWQGNWASAIKYGERDSRAGAGEEANAARKH